MRRVLMILGGVLLIALLVPVVIVVPALVQVRGIEPALPSEDALRALLDVENGPVGIRYVNTSSQPVRGSVLGHTVFLAEWSNGELFMIDTGMDRPQAIEFGELMKRLTDAGEAEPHGTIAELLGPDVDRVAGVAYTHLHIDHSQGTIDFCKARGPGAVVFQTSWQAGFHNFNTEEAAEIVADSCLSPRRASEDPLGTTNRFPGLGIVALGGHTPGSTLFAIPVDGHLWIFSGDITNSKRDILTNTGKEWLYSNVFVPEHTTRNEALRLWLADLDSRPDMTVVVSHDLPDIQASGLPEYRRSSGRTLR